MGGISQDVKRLKKKVEFLPFILWVFLTIYTFVALMAITMCFKKLEAGHIMSCDSWYKAPALVKSFSSLWDMRFLKSSAQNSRMLEFDCWVNVNILIIFSHIMNRFYLLVQTKSLNGFKCGWIIPNVYIKKCKNSQFFGAINFKASPSIYIYFFFFFLFFPWLS